MRYRVEFQHPATGIPVEAEWTGSYVEFYVADDLEEQGFEPDLIQATEEALPGRMPATSWQQARAAHRRVARDQFDAGDSFCEGDA